jgi:hypothetical protein
MHTAACAQAVRARAPNTPLTLALADELNRPF